MKPEDNPVPFLSRNIEFSNYYIEFQPPPELTGVYGDIRSVIQFRGDRTIPPTFGAAGPPREHKAPPPPLARGVSGLLHASDFMLAQISLSINFNLCKMSLPG